jgi:hypothetical protein
MAGVVLMLATTIMPLVPALAPFTPLVLKLGAALGLLGIGDKAARVLNAMQ